MLHTPISTHSNNPTETEETPFNCIGTDNIFVCEGGKEGGGLRLSMIDFYNLIIWSSSITAKYRQNPYLYTIQSCTYERNNEMSTNFKILRQSQIKQNDECEQNTFFFGNFTGISMTTILPPKKAYFWYENIIIWLYVKRSLYA